MEYRAVVRKNQLIAPRMAELLFHSRHRTKPLAMIKAYIDESGTHQGSNVLIIAGYVGTTDEWESVEARFKKADRLSGRIFHAVDCAGGGKAFRGLHRDKRYRLFRKMVKIVNDHDIFGIGTGALIDDYSNVYPRNGQNWEKWLTGAYETAFGDTIIEVCHYSKERYGESPVSFVVEDSEHWYPSAARVFLQMKADVEWPYHTLLETIAPYSSEQARQLHAADILAYETYLMKSREINPTKHGPREHLLNLLKKKKNGRIWNEYGFRELEKFRVKDEAKESASGV
jgi:hypothetical protein